MSDIFREVEEEVRRERLDKIWKEYGDYIVAGACLLVIGAAGLQLWRTYDANQHLKAADQYAAAEQMAEAGQIAQAADAFGHLAESAPGGYKVLARLQHADTLLATGERGDALNLYKQVANGDDPLLGAVARMRGAWAIADYAPRAEVASTLGPLTDAGNPWHSMAQEVLAYWDYRTGATKAALGEYDAIAHDTKAPKPLQERAKIIADFLRAGGGSDYGTVPQVPAPPRQAFDPATLMANPGAPAPTGPAPALSDPNAPDAHAPAPPTAPGKPHP